MQTKMPDTSQDTKPAKKKTTTGDEKKSKKHKKRKVSLEVNPATDQR
jgi:hypothetical protein